MIIFYNIKALNLKGFGAGILRSVGAQFYGKTLKL